MTRSAIDFLHDIYEADLAGDVKKFQKNPNGPAAGSLRDVQKNIEAAQHHSEMSQQHQGMAVTAKGQGNRAAASLHADAADHHAALSSTHTDLAQKQLQKKPGSQNLGEGFGLKEVDPATLYKPFDPRVKVDYTPLAPRSQHFTVSDLRRVVETVCQEHHTVLQVLRFDHDGAGFLGQVTSGAGMFPGTSPSCTQLEQAFVQKIRAEHTTGVVELLDQTDIPPTAPGGYSSRKSVWRFSLKAKKNVW